MTPSDKPMIPLSGQQTDDGMPQSEGSAGASDEVDEGVKGGEPADNPHLCRELPEESGVGERIRRRSDGMKEIYIAYHCVRMERQTDGKPSDLATDQTGQQLTFERRNLHRLAD